MIIIKILIESICKLNKNEYELLIDNSEENMGENMGGNKGKRVIPINYDEAGGDCCTQQTVDICGWCKYHPKILSVRELPGIDLIYNCIKADGFYTIIYQIYNRLK